MYLTRRYKKIKYKVCSPKSYTKKGSSHISESYKLWDQLWRQQESNKGLLPRGEEGHGKERKGELWKLLEKYCLMLFWFVHLVDWKKTWIGMAGKYNYFFFLKSCWVLTVLGLRCFLGFPLVLVSGDCSVGGLGFSLGGFSCCRAQALGMQAR